VGDARYPLSLLLRVITVSLETMKLVNALPALDILEEAADSAGKVVPFRRFTPKPDERYTSCVPLVDLQAAVLNGNDPGGGKLPEADTADMETYFENVQLLLPTLGVSVFAAESIAAGGEYPVATELTLEMSWEDAHAECAVRDGQFVVTAGSTARTKEVASLGVGSRALRKRLIETGVLVPAGQDGLLRFTQTYAFDSPSAAASVVAGTGLNGRAQWLVKGEDMSYKAWQERLVPAEPTSETA